MLSNSLGVPFTANVGLEDQNFWFSWSFLHTLLRKESNSSSENIMTFKKKLHDIYHYILNVDFPYSGQAMVLLSLSCVSQRKWDPLAQTLNLSRSWVGEWTVCSKHREWHVHRSRNERL